MSGSGLRCLYRDTTVLSRVVRVQKQFYFFEEKSDSRNRGLLAFWL